jgi:D-alanyl-lipoteichoic acid acyltransferase DltB (MBOAT superfamily)
VHKLYADRTRWWYQGMKSKPTQLRVLEWTGIFLTFHYVVLGWVWFALPTPELSVSVLRRLLGWGA